MVESSSYQLLIIVTHSIVWLHKRLTPLIGHAHWKNESISCPRGDHSLTTDSGMTPASETAGNWIALEQKEALSSKCPCEHMVMHACMAYTAGCMPWRKSSLLRHPCSARCCSADMSDWCNDTDAGACYLVAASNYRLLRHSLLPANSTPTLVRTSERGR